MSLHSGTIRSRELNFLDNIWTSYRSEDMKRIQGRQLHNSLEKSLFRRRNFFKNVCAGNRWICLCSHSRLSFSTYTSTKYQQSTRKRILLQAILDGDHAILHMVITQIFYLSLIFAIILFLDELPTAMIIFCIET